MPSLAYRDNNNFQYMPRMGSAFADAAVGLQRLKLYQQQREDQQRRNLAMYQLAVERYNLQREKEDREKGVSDTLNQMRQAQTGAADLRALSTQQNMDLQQAAGRLAGYRKSPMLMDLVRDPTSGPQMMTDLRTMGVAPQGQFQLDEKTLRDAINAAAYASLVERGAGSPAAAASMTKMLPGRPGETFVNPITMQPEMQLPFEITPAQQQGLDLRRQQIADAASYHATQLQQQDRHNREMEANARDRNNRPGKTSAKDTLNQLLQDAAAKRAGANSRTNSPPVQVQVGRFTVTPIP